MDPPPVAALESAKYEFASSAESTIEFVATDRAGKHRGRIRSFSGTVNVAHGRTAEASVSVDIDVSSLQADDATLDAPLKSGKVLNVRVGPHAHFVSTSVESGGVQGATDTVKGNLELLGVTRPVEIPSTIHVGPSGVYLDGELDISRKAFGLILPGKYEATVSDRVVISLVISAKRVH